MNGILLGKDPEGSASSLDVDCPHTVSSILILGCYSSLFTCSPLTSLLRSNAFFFFFP